MASDYCIFTSNGETECSETGGGRWDNLSSENIKKLFLQHHIDSLAGKLHQCRQALLFSKNGYAGVCSRIEASHGELENNIRQAVSVYQGSTDSENKYSTSP